MNKYHIVFWLIFLIAGGKVFSQQELRYYGGVQDIPAWAVLMYNENADAGDVIKAYEEYYRSHPLEKNEHTQYYKRWLRSLSREQTTNGRTPADRRYLQNRVDESSQWRTEEDQWISLGPWDWDHDAADRSYAPGAAHVYTVEQSIADPDVLYAGTATAGIWKSIDHGSSWSSVTSGMMVNGLTALEINHSNSNCVYAELLSSIYKTIDGGISWAPTGSPSFQAASINTAYIVMHPQDSQIVWAATNSGLYQTTDGGSTWNLKIAGDFQEIEFHPTNFDTIYFVEHSGDITRFHRTLNSGSTFSLETNGWPAPDTGAGEHQRRTEIAVSPDDPDLVVALATGSANGGSGLYGIYVSSDAGSSWTFQCCGPQPAGMPSETNMNLMGWSDQGLDDGGQYYYDLALDISPTNADSIFVAGVNLWISDDGGASFVCPAKWSHPHKPGYVHADIHDIHYYSETGEIWVGCDGGIFHSVDNGINFTRRMTGISGTDFWGFGAGQRDGDVMLGGTYHNGTLLKDDTVYINDWICTDGGDNYRGFVHPVNIRQAFSDYNIKTLSGNRLENNATRAFGNKPNASYTIGRSSDLLFHPTYADTWYSGSGSSLWRTDDNGQTFTQLRDFGASLASMDMCFTNPEVIYVSTFPEWWDTKTIWRTTDGGETWDEITPPTDVLSGNLWVPYDIAVSATDPDDLWAARTSMYAGTDMNGVEIIRSTDGGATWTNFTGDLPLDEQCTSIAHHQGSDGGIYIGTRRAVYYRNNTLGGWQLYSAGLPATTVSTRLIINYQEQKIRNGTNRSVWERSLYENASPIAQASVKSPISRCLRDTVYYFDNSILSGDNATWEWSFPGGNPSTSSVQDPKVVYDAPGIYDLTLIVTDAYGSDTSTVTGIISIIDECGLDEEPGTALRTNVSPDYCVVPDIGITVDSFTLTAWIKPDGIQNDYSAILMNDGAAAGLNFREGNNTLGYHWPGGQWWWDSGLVAPADVWSHVALVVTPSAVRIYLNGAEAEHNITPDSVALGTMKIGSYKGWNDRNYRGLIDEVSIYDRALTRHEIMASKHLTRILPGDPALIAYYQFNEGGTVVFDKAGSYNSSLNGGATKVRSRAPLGAGISEVDTILAEGTYPYESTGIEFTFGSASALPNGEVWVSRLEVAPDTMPSGYGLLHNGYWIVNNYGTNSIISDPLEIIFQPIGFVSDSMAASDPGNVFSRGENEEITEWNNATLERNLIAGLQGGLESSSYKAIEFGQFLLMRDSFPTGTPAVSFGEPGYNIARRGGGSVQADFNATSGRALRLPVLTAEYFEGTPSPEEGLIAFHDEEKTLCLFDGSVWRLFDHQYLGTGNLADTLETRTFTSDTSVSSSAILYLANSGFVLPNPIPDNDFVNIDYPPAGLVVYRADSHLPAIYDGAEWRLVATTESSMVVNDIDPPVQIEGMLIGGTEKSPSAALQVISPNTGLGLPLIPTEEVTDPRKGFVVFDPRLRALCFFDGTAWQKVEFQ